MKQRYPILLLLMFFTLPAFSQISGTVFRDYNGDGVKQATEPGVAGIIVNAYDASNTVLNTTTTAIGGTYSLPFTVPVRVEFEIVPDNCSTHLIDYPGWAPLGNNVRFIAASSTTEDFAIQNPEEYNNTPNPDAFISRFNRGDPLLPGTAATAEAFYGFPYQLTGSNVTTPYELEASHIGSCWGVAYSKHAKKIFTSAFLKRFSGMGPLGSGGIYLLEPASPTFNVVNFYDMDANGYRTRAAASAPAYGVGSSFSINGAGTQATYLGPIDPVSGSPEGLGVIGVNGPGGRDMTPSTTGQWNDPAAVDQVGKVGIGDIDISEDGKFLFVTNLYDKNIYRLELDNVVNPTSVVSVSNYPLPPIVVNNGVLRPFGLAYHKGLLYIGAVSTGENGGQNVLNGPTDLYAYVFEMTDPLKATATINPTPILTFPLNYQKGYAIGGGNASNRWYPWNSNTAALLPTGELTLPCPVLSDIGFTERGDMILDFMDRSGHQFAGISRQHLTGTTMIGSFVIGGDLLMAGKDCNTNSFTLENNGSYTSTGTPYSSAGIGNNQGPGGGEFFIGDVWGSFHWETSVGSLAVIPGIHEVITSRMDPIGAFSNGTIRFNTSDGSSANGLELATNGQFGKANGMGDIEVSGDVPFIQIGNRVWSDLDSDGIQDPSEPGIANVTLELFADFNADSIPDGVALGTTTTDGKGQYYFDNTNVADGDPVSAGAQPGPIAYHNYLIRIAASDWTGGAGVNELLTYTVTQKDVGGAGQPDVRDNDAELINAIPTVIAFCGMNSENKPDFDFGFNQCKPVDISDVSLNCIDTSAVIGPIPEPGVNYTWQPPTGLSSTTIAQPTASPSGTTIYTLTVDDFCIHTLTVNVDVTPPPADAGPVKTLDCFTTSVQIGTPALPGLQYHWEPAASLSDPNSAQPIASPSETTTYTLTVTGLNGCISQAEVEVKLDECCTKMVVPNSFSPNGDKINDEFGIIEVLNVKSFTLKVFNRFGEMVFSSNRKDVKWDGTYKGEDCDLGTYFYLVVYQCQNGKVKKQLQGDVNLIR